MLNKKPASRQALENLKRIPVDTDAPQQRWSTRRRILATVTACALTLSMIPAAGLAAASAAGTSFDQTEVNEPTTTEAAPSSDQPTDGADGQADKVDQTDKANKASEKKSSAEKSGEDTPSKEADQASADSPKQSTSSNTNENNDTAFSIPKTTSKDAEGTSSTPESITDEKVPLTEGSLTDGISALIPETKVFTDAGPFLPPVNVGQPLRMKAARQAVDAREAGAQNSSVSNGTDSNNGLELSKTVKANNDGTYTVSLEAYTTGKVATTTKSVPVDIVLVLDQSGSMAQSFDGRELTDWLGNNYKYEESRQYAMKNAVKGFLNEIKNKNVADESDHRVSIVTFSGGGEDYPPDSTIVANWTEVRGNGYNDLVGSVDSLNNKPEGATRIDAGLNDAADLISTRYNYIGENTDRQKVVVVFTDGSPTNDSSYQDNIANNAIASAKAIKDSGATVYSIGIMQGANPDQLCSERKYGEERKENRPYTVKENEQVQNWRGDWYDQAPGHVIEEYPLIGGGTVSVRSYIPHNCKENDPINCKNNEKDEIAKINRFMNFISSNFKDAENQSISDGKPVKTGDGYYLTAANSEDLNNIFASISQNIQTPTIDLGSETVVQDAVSKYFDLPSDTAEIKVYTAAYKGDGTFADRKDAGLQPIIDKGSVSVVGFDFNANFVSDKPKNEEDTNFGKKLIIEFTVKPKEGFAGGNDVPTNVSEASGVFDKNNNEIEKFATDDTTPKVNVPIKQNELEKLLAANDRTVYEGQTIKSSDLWKKSAANDWAFKFVDVTPSVTGETAGAIQPESCGSYDVVLTCTPISDGANAAGESNPTEGVTVTKQAQVHVLKSELKASKVTKYYGESYKLGDGANVSIDWKDAKSHTNAPKPDGDAPYDSTSPLNYEAAGFSDGQGTIPAEPFDVTVKVRDGAKGVEVGYYHVGVKTCSLKITKQVQGSADGGSFVFNVTNNGELVPAQKLVINGAGSKTILGLPVGTYAVNEDEDWAWRYAAKYAAEGNGQAVLSSTNPDGEVKIENAKDNHRWISSEASCNNIFVGKMIVNQVSDIAVQAAAQVAGE